MTAAGRAAVLWALALGGCTALDAHSFDRATGWRSAQVVAVGSAAELAPAVDRDCGGGNEPSSTYAVVRYRNGGVHTRSLGTAHLPAGAELKVGDAVHVNVLDCAVPLVAAQSDRSSAAPSR